MHLLITGNLGYVGSTMVPLALQAGHTVTGLDSGLFQQPTASNLVDGIEFIDKDIRDTTVEDFRGIDAVFHLASLSNDPLGNIDPGLTHEINGAASLELAELAKLAGVSRFLFASTCSVYGGAGNRLITESHDPSPITPYAASKLFAENRISKLADENFCPVFLRYATAYGASEIPRFDLVLNDFVVQAISTRKISLISDGSPWRPMIHVDDMANAALNILLADRQSVSGQAINIGCNTENFQVIELARMVTSLVPQCEVICGDSGSTDNRSYRVCFDKLNQLVPKIEWQWDMESGIRDMIGCFSQYIGKQENIYDSRYYRIDHLKQLLGDGVLDSELRPVRKSRAASMESG